MSDGEQPKDILPRPVRLLLGATNTGISESRLRREVAGHTILITGASSGIGEASARRLAGAGATVLLVARSVDKLEALRDELTAAGATAFVHSCDMGDTEAVGRLAVDVLAQHGHVDVVVNNAGLSIRRWIAQSYDRFHDFERTININYLGPVRLMLGLLPSMRERGSGHIVNVATMGVDFPPMRWSAYIASKSAFEVWLSGAAPEIRADGVTVTSIHMQLVRSPMLGPFRMWRYIPGMSTEEAAGMVARAAALKPRRIAPSWSRIGGPLTDIAQGGVERVMAYQARQAIPRSRPRAPEGDHGSGPLGSTARVAEEVAGAVTTIAALGVVRPVRPDRLARAAAALQRYGGTPAFTVASAAALHPGRPAIIDELGTITFGRLDEECRALAGALHRHFDLVATQRVAIMCRNHRGYVHAAAAAARLGCDLVPLNTDFAGPQLGDVLARERVTAAIYDEEFEPVFDASGFDGTRIIAWHDPESKIERPTLASLIDLREADAPPPRETGRAIMLTSGTTGTPKGAIRTVSARAVAQLAVGGFLELARLKPTPRSGEPVLVAPPLFHLYGMIGLSAAFALGSPMVIRRRFNAEAALRDIDRHRVGLILAVPTMYKRMMDVPAPTRRTLDFSSLRMALTGAAPLPPELSTAIMDEFGEILFNGYASTEVGSGTLATPSDLRAAPGTVGHPMAGVTIRILDEEGLEVPAGETGRIFIGGPLNFDGYTGGGGKQVIDGLMSSGDVGHFDRAGRLFIDGRDDDMILSGGENVFPQEVEELLVAHDAVADAAVFGAPDPDFGQRLAAFVLLKADAAKPSEEELQSYVKQHLARYKTPREIVFVEQLPRTSTGKLQRRKLAELYTSTRT
jgi:acyl-CoA synthetase (AMP-forming)/AMP-acid ligase II/NAD(P)-dependent dehydrogenase (short-subunit alcohol dehydrogenase family)